jgi:polyphenol oxidase
MMRHHHDAFFSITFGSQAHGYVPREFQGLLAHERAPFKQLFPEVEQLVFLHQVHGTQGKVVRTGDVELPSFVHDGDFLLTQQPQVGIGISTADCLPIVLVDSVTKAVGVVHAGWRGSYAGIAGEAVVRMQELYGTKPADITAFFGPSALACCYEVQPSFQEQFGAWIGAPFSVRNNKLYFDVARFNEQQLQAQGVTQIDRTYQVCTICNPGFCSVRVNPKSLERQMTVVRITSL